MSDPVLAQIDAAIERGPNRYSWDPDYYVQRNREHRATRQRWIDLRASEHHPAVLAVLDLHQPDDNGDCTHCVIHDLAVQWPCETAEVLITALTPTDTDQKKDTP